MRDLVCWLLRVQTGLHCIRWAAEPSDAPLRNAKQAKSVLEQQVVVSIAPAMRVAIVDMPAPINACSSLCLSARDKWKSQRESFFSAMRWIPKFTAGATCLHTSPLQPPILTEADADDLVWRTTRSVVCHSRELVVCHSGEEPPDRWLFSAVYASVGTFVTVHTGLVPGPVAITICL